jgi:hypothetical protein
MNPKGRDFPGAGGVSRKRFLLASFLAMLCALLTGCPHNDYTVELKPKTNVVERTLIFYRADGINSNGVPDYQAFPSNELAAITRVYPSAAVKPDGQRYLAQGEFAGPLPNDVGGVGSYTNLVTSLGDAGFYMERFRGHDDLATKTARRFHAADQIADLVIGWTQTELGRERGYKNLRKFLDEDFRRDLKNAGLYLWTGEVSTFSDTNAPEEFTARFCQYLFERGYLKLSDAPELYLIIKAGGDDAALLRLIQRLAAEKMGVPAAEPLPKSFAVLNDSNALEKSWEHYLARSDLYRAKVKAWERKKKTDSKLEPPKPLNTTDDLFAEFLDGSGGEPDHLTVKLSLDHAPSHTNGKWQDGQVVWKANLEVDRALPAFCYASWSNPDVQFQKARFGRVILNGDELAEYCLWQSGLGEEQVHEWESFLAGLQAGKERKNKLDAFQFAAEPAPSAVKGKQNQLDIGRKLLRDALGKETDAGLNSKQPVLIP